MDTIQDILDHNKNLTGRRRLRVLEDNDILDLINYAWANYNSPEKLAHYYELGGSVANAYNYPAITTIAYAFFNKEKHLVVGVTTCDANKPSPGRAWQELQPFGVGHDSTVIEKAARWAHQCDKDKSKFNIGRAGLNQKLVKSYRS